MFKDFIKYVGDFIIKVFRLMGEEEPPFTFYFSWVGKGGNIIRCEEGSFRGERELEKRFIIIKEEGGRQHGNYKKQGKGKRDKHKKAR